MKKLIILSLAVFTWFFVIACEAEQDERTVSLVELIVLPEKYVGHKIRVKGFFEAGISAAIYLNHISAEITDTSSSILVLDPTSNGELTLSCENRYVAISGQLIDSHNRYVVANVEKVLDIQNREYCWERQEKKAESEQ